MWKATAYTECKPFSLFSYVKKNNAHTYVLQSTEASTNQFMIYGQIPKSNLNNIKEYSSGLLLQSLAMLSIEKYKTHHCTWQPEKKKKQQQNQNNPNNKNKTKIKSKTKTTARQLYFDTREPSNCQGESQTSSDGSPGGEAWTHADTVLQVLQVRCRVMARRA